MAIEVHLGTMEDHNGQSYDHPNSHGYLPNLPLFRRDRAKAGTCENPGLLDGGKAHLDRAAIAVGLLLEVPLAMQTRCPYVMFQA
jgi:hypothetical protein